MADKKSEKPNSAFPWKEVGKLGLFGGIALVLVSAIGMVETFGARDIISGLITMGQSLLLILVLLTSYMAAKRVRGKNRGKALLAGTLSGLISTALLAGLLLLSQAVNLRQIFVNISPGLISILTFDKALPGELSSAVLLLFIYGGLIGLLAAGFSILPDGIRKAVTAGLLWVSGIGLTGELIRTVLTGRAFAGLIQGILGGRSQQGISPIGAVIVFILVAGLNYAWQKNGARVRARVSAAKQALPARTQRMVNPALIFIGFLLLWQLPSLFGLYLSDVANNIGLYILMGLGLNIVVGFAGLLDLGYVAFFAIGAYVMGVATSGAVGDGSGEIVFSLGWTFWQALPLAIGIAMLAGVLLGVPVLKMRGDYLAIVTLGFGEIIRILANSDWLKPYIGGAQGIVDIQPIMIAGQSYSRSTELFHIVLIGCLIVGFIAWRLRSSRAGRAWKALREDEDVAEAMGINLVRTKLLAFAAGAAFSGLAGAIFASKLTSIQPGSFSLQVSISILALIIVGGMGSIPGVIVGALVLIGAPELLREFDQYRLLVFGAVLVIMMLYKPEGLWPEETHKLELHVDENLPAA